MVDRQQSNTSFALPAAALQQHTHQPHGGHQLLPQQQQQQQHNGGSPTTTTATTANDNKSTLSRSLSVDTLEEEEKDILHHLQDLDLFALPGGGSEAAAAALASGGVVAVAPPSQQQQPAPNSNSKEGGGGEGGREPAAPEQQPPGNNDAAPSAATTAQGEASSGGGSLAASASASAAAAPLHHDHHHNNDDLDAHSAVADLSLNLQVPDSPGGSSVDWNSFLNFSSSNHQQHGISNAVHMHIQENAKLPTFNLPVNRKGSTDNPHQHQQQYRHYYYQNLHNPHHYPGGAGGASVPGMSSTGSINSTGVGGGGGSVGSHPRSSHNNYRMRRGEELSQVAGGGADMSRLSEMFLMPQHRQSYHASYAQAGALSHDTRTVAPPPLKQQHQKRNSMVGMEITLDSSPSSPPNSNYSKPLVDPLDALAAQVDPTPLSEIRRRHEYHHQKQHSPPKPSSPPTAAAPSPTAAAAAAAAPNAGSYHPPITMANIRYRSLPLPIPTKNVSPPETPPLNAVQQQQLQPQSVQVPQSQLPPGPGPSMPLAGHPPSTTAPAPTD